MVSIWSFHVFYFLTPQDLDFWFLLMSVLDLVIQGHEKCGDFFIKVHLLISHEKCVSLLAMQSDKKYLVDRS